MLWNGGDALAANRSCQRMTALAVPVCRMLSAVPWRSDGPMQHARRGLV